MEAEYGQINLHIKEILNIQNLCSQSLARITPESVKRIENNMRGMHKCLTTRAQNGGTPLEEIYGFQFAARPSEFVFMEGEVQCLLDLADIIKAKGIKPFIRMKTSNPGQRAKKNDPPNASVLIQNAVQKIRSRIINYFETRFIFILFIYVA